MATLNVTITEEMTLNGKDQGNTNTLSISSVTAVINRIMTIDNTEEDILNFQAAREAAGAIEDGTLQYLRLTHIGSANTILLRIQSTVDTKEYIVQLAAGESFMLFNDNAMDVNTGGDIDSTASLSQLDTIKALCSSGDGAELELFAVAS
tara:strand:+ start:1128 stop:1577 length:450 start_codon:yes stop_codon:yes gene_type:complete